MIFRAVMTNPKDFWLGIPIKKGPGEFTENVVLDNWKRLISFMFSIDFRRVCVKNKTYMVYAHLKKKRGKKNAEPVLGAWIFAY